MFNEICLCTLHYLLLGSNSSWVSLSCIFTDLLCHCYHNFWTSFTIWDWHLFLIIYHLVVTCIERHIFVPNLSMSCIFISILKFFCCFLILCNWSTFNIQHSKTFKNHIYTIFEKIYSFYDFSLFPHAYPMRDANNKEMGFYLLHVRSIGCIHWYMFQR